MIENIIEDGMNDFFFTHLIKYRKAGYIPFIFTGSNAYGFKDVIKGLCNSYEMEGGSYIKTTHGWPHTIS
jgi:hypothetical protein